MLHIRKSFCLVFSLFISLTTLIIRNSREKREYLHSY